MTILQEIFPLHTKNWIVKKNNNLFLFLKYYISDRNKQKTKYHFTIRPRFKVVIINMGQ